MGTPITDFSLHELITRIADYTSDAIMIAEAEPFDEPGPRIVYVNPAFTRMTGYASEEVVGRTPRMLQGPGSSAATRRAIRQALQAWKPVTAEVLNYRKDGTPFWVELSIVPVADASGWYHYWVSVQRDVTERRRHEQELLWRDQIMQTFADGVVVADASQPDMPVVYVNDVILRMTGYAREDFIGRNCRFLQGPETDPAAVALLREGIASGRPVTAELVNYRKDGSKFWNLVTLSPMLDPDGRMHKVVGVQRDISDVKARDQQMVIAQRMRAVGELAGGIAHDFNNLLTSILGSAQLLEDGLGRAGADPALLARVRTITGAAQHGAAQVKRLMSLSRTPLLMRAPVDLRGVAEQLLQLLTRTLPEHIDVRVDIPEVARWVDAEPVQMESALLNLVINARDAMPAGGIVRLRSRAFSEGGRDWVRLSVEDEGVGIDEATLQRVFDPFFTTKEPGHGSGLGLAMVHSFVNHMGGRVEVASVLGKGTCFDLVLPAAHVGDDATAATRAAALAAWAPPGSGATVLLVEDDPVVRLTAQAMLEHMGHQVLTAASGQEALEVLRTPLPLDLLFTDLLMPGGLNGRQLARRARLLRPGLAVLLASGWADASLDEPEAGDVSAPFLAKPYSMEELAQALAGVLRP